MLLSAFLKAKIFDTEVVVLWLLLWCKANFCSNWSCKLWQRPLDGSEDALLLWQGRPRCAASRLFMFWQRWWADEGSSDGEITVVSNRIRLFWSKMDKKSYFVVFFHEWKKSVGHVSNEMEKWTRYDRLLYHKIWEE